VDEDHENEEELETATAGSAPRRRTGGPGIGEARGELLGHHAGLGAAGMRFAGFQDDLPDQWLDEMIRPNGQWSRERAIIFTEYRATQKWLFEMLAPRAPCLGKTAGFRLLSTQEAKTAPWPRIWSGSDNASRCYPLSFSSP